MRFFIALMMSLILFQSVAYANEPPLVEAAGAVLMERSSGRILFGQNEDVPLPIASTTKVMTALLALEKCDLTEMVTIGENASGVPGTSIYLTPGEQLTVKDLLLGLLLRSGNDAAVALAEHIAGSVDAFAEMMNSRAEELGAVAHFVNPNGLDDKAHLVTARGLALIAREALDFPSFRELVTTHKATIPWEGNPYDRVLTNKNKLLGTYEGATGVKTGFTKVAGRCLVFSAERNGMELLGVVLNCGNWFETAAQLMDWGFDTYRRERFLTSGQVMEEIPVTGGMKSGVRVICPSALFAPVSSAESPRLVVEMEERLPAPVNQGTIVGMARVEVGNEVIAEQWLVADETVDECTYPRALDRVLHLFNPAN